jgi:hypothetical protein
MVVPLAGVDQYPGAPTINAQNINDGSLGPWGGGSGPHRVMMEIRERPASMRQMSTVGPRAP